jgi:hypothetical protein
MTKLHHMPKRKTKFDNPLEAGRYFLKLKEKGLSVGEISQVTNHMHNGFKKASSEMLKPFLLILISPELSLGTHC